MSDKWSAHSGFACTWLSLWAGGDNALDWLKNVLTDRAPMPTLVDPVLAISLPISGLINPLFLLTVAFMEFKPFVRPRAILRIVLLLLFPVCWVVFFHDELHPREGYFLWIAGMLLVLFSNEISNLNAHTLQD